MDVMPVRNVDLTETTRLLLQMRENCVPKDTDTYDDPQRKAKYDALSYAIDVINNPSMAAMSMVGEEHFAVVENDCVEFYSKDEFYATPSPK